MLASTTDTISPSYLPCCELLVDEDGRVACGLNSGAHLEVLAHMKLREQLPCVHALLRHRLAH